MRANLYLQFEEQVKRTPHLPCLSDGHTTLTYEQVHIQVECQTQIYLANGIKYGHVVALYSDKTIGSVICFLTIFRLGGILLTLDKAFPTHMLSFIIEDAGVQFIISDNDFPITTTIPIIPLPSIHFNAAPLQIQATPLPSSSQSAKWIVYSSGTTGDPKGIVLDEYAIISSMLSRYQFSDYNSDDKVACSIYFFWEIFRPLLKGACAYIVKDDLLLDLKQYALFIQKHAITETLWTPSFTQMLLQCLPKSVLPLFSSVKRIWLNGEVVSGQLVEKALTTFRHIQFLNLYSISETIDVTAHLLSITELSKDGFACIGRPLPHVKIWVLDESLNPCAPYQHGELYISSPMLADGYLNRNALQTQAFVNLPHIHAEPLFKTKDAAYQNNHGELFLLGRKDYIVKLRGYNISLLAIEDILKKYLPIKSCVVEIHGDNPINQHIAATLQPQDKISMAEQYSIDANTGASDKLQRLLAQYLPHYAVPAKFYLTDAFKWNYYSAKQERKPIRHQNQAINYPQSGLNSTRDLKTLWHDILQLPVEHLDETCDFFACGANSLQAMHYIQRFQEIFGITIDLATLYQQSTFKQHLQWLEGSKSTKPGPNAKEMLADLSLSLPKTICKSPVISLQDAKHVILTGATGFLGSHWLAHSLKHSSCVYHCLIRAGNVEQGFRRLQQVFKKYQLDVSLLNNRVKVIPGSLQQHNLGQSANQWQYMVKNIDLIFHAAAHVNLLHTYDVLKEDMTVGMKTLLTLATNYRLKPMVLISSDAVFPDEGSYDCSAFLPEHTLKKLTYGYAQAKWMQEKLLEKAANGSYLPFFIARLGNLSASLKTNQYNKQDSNAMMAQFIIKHRILPSTILMEFTPVDKIVHFLTEKLATNIDNTIVTLTDLNILKTQDIQKYYTDYSLTKVDDTSWATQLKRHDPRLYALWQQELFSRKKCTLIQSEKHKANVSSLILSHHTLKQSLVNLAQIFAKELDEAVSY